jgi:trans-aconitate 2-methyltransferase
MAWDPKQYDKFKKERSRPFFDLLAQLDDISPKSVVDLGCGTGELTAELARKWPQAEVMGVDSSPEMLEKSKPHAGEHDGGVDADQPGGSHLLELGLPLAEAA